MNSSALFIRFYSEASHILDGKRAGHLLYELSLLFLGKRLDDTRERYDKYGYSWYLDKIAYYEDLILSVGETLGKDGFISAASMAMFALSLSAGLTNTDGGLALSDADVLFILKYQGEYFSECDIGADEWRIFAAVFTEFIPERSATLIDAELYSLKKSGYFITLSEVMPKAIDFYRSFTAALSAMGELSLSGEPEKTASAIASAVIECREELVSLLHLMEEKGKSSTASEADVLRSLGLVSDFEEFAVSHGVIDAEELLSAIEDIAKKDGTSGDALSSAIISYMLGVAPYITFALYS